MKTKKLLHLSYLAMITVVALSNYLVQFPINNWLTWGAFFYPITFFVNEMTNRVFGPKQARRVVYVGFFLGVNLSFLLSSPKMALASGMAFLVAQMGDIWVFSHLRLARWWLAPICASVLASTVDSAIFWPLAFFGEDLPILTWALGDLGVKIALDIGLLLPFRAALNRLQLSNFAFQSKAIVSI